MSLSPVELRKLQIHSFPINKQSYFSFEKAGKRDITSLLREQIEFYQTSEVGQVINIYGPFKSGKSAVAKSLSKILPSKKDKAICVTFDFEEADSDIQQNDIVIIEQGDKYISHKDYSDIYGLETIKNACNNKNATAIVVSDKKLWDKELQADFYLRTLAIDKEKKVNTCLLEVENFVLGYIEIDLIHDEEIEDAFKEAKADYLKSEVQRIYENIQETTEEFIKELLIPRDIIFSKDEKELRKTENAINMLKIITIGAQRAGKTTLLEIFHQLICDYYQVKNVHAVMHKDQLTSLLMHGFEKKFVNFLVSNDFTYNQANLFDLRKYISFAHTMYEKTGLRQGLGVVNLNLHQLSGKGAERAYRLFIDLFILLTYPTDSWTKDYFKKYVPESYLEFLRYIDTLKKEAMRRGDKETWNRLKGYGLAVGRGYILPFYLNTVDYPAKEIPELVLPEVPEEKASPWEKWETTIIEAGAQEIAQNHEVFGYKNLIPRLDSDITEGYLLENYPVIRNLAPKRRYNLAGEVFALAKYHAWKELDSQEEVLESKWIGDWENYVDKILENLESEISCPNNAVLHSIIDDLELDTYKLIRRESYAGVNYRTKIINRIKKAFHAVDKEQKQQRQQASENYLKDPIHNLKMAMSDYYPKYRLSINDWFDNTIYKEKVTSIQRKRGLKSHSSVSGNISYFEDVIKPEIEGSRKGTGLAWETAIFNSFIRIIFEHFSDLKKELKIVAAESQEESLVEDILVRGIIRDTKKEGWEEDTYTFSLFKENSTSPLLSFLWLGGEGRVDFELLLPNNHHLALECKNALFSNKHSYSLDKLKPLKKSPLPGAKKYLISFSPGYLDRVANYQESLTATQKSVTVGKDCKGFEGWVGEIIEQIKKELAKR